VQGDGEWGLRSVQHTWALPLLPPQGKNSSHSAPAPARGPSHERQFSMNCSSVGPSHGVQSFRNRCSSVGPPWGHTPCQQICSSVGSSLCWSTGPARSLLQHRLPMGSQPPLGTPHSGMGYPWTAGGDGLHHGPPWAAGESLLRHLEHLLPLLLH